MDLRRSPAALAALALACALGACADPRTELVVVIHSEIAELDEVRVDVSIEGRSTPVQSIPVPVEGLESFPLTFGLTSRSHSDSLVVIDVSGRAGGGEVVFREARTRFAPRRSRVLVIVLERACAHVRCSEDRTTCIEAICQEAYVGPDRLPSWQGSLPDAGVTRVDDAGTAPIDGGSDAGQDGGPSCQGDAGLAGMPDGCTLRRWPARPTCGESGDDGRERFVALLDPDLDQGGAWRTLGYDLDGLCTDPLVPGTPTECGVDGGTLSADGVGGIDNSAGGLFASTLTSALPEYESRSRDTVREGRNVPILRLAGWSGEPDDARVEVWLAGSVDIVRSEEATPDGGTFDSTIPHTDPRWDGTDVAYVSSSYFAADSMPLIGDDNAYVAGGVLVVRLPDRAPIDLPTANGVGRIRLTDTRLVATIAPDGRSLTDTVVVGRWAQADLLAYTEDVGLCPGDPMVDMLLPVFLSLVEHSVDVRSSPGTGGPGIPCNALSIALPFEATAPVLLGGSVTQELVPAGCP